MDTIDVTLLLEGGHEYRLRLAADSALLRRLFRVMVDSVEERAQTLFQIPLDGGDRALCVPGDRLVGLVTYPPIFIQDPHAEATEDEDESDTSNDSDEPPDPPDARSRSTAMPLAHHEVLPTRYLHLDNFLPIEQYQALLEFVLAQESAFVSSSTSTQDTDYRRSLVLYSFPEFAQLMGDRIETLLPDILQKLALHPFASTQIEAQITAHNDGHYYRLHNDNGSPDTASRTLTYVYYFNQQPQAFSGGELRLYDSRIHNNFYVRADSYHLIEPRNNSIVFFPSHAMHEVLPIRCPSRAFADSRFTINGWVRR